MDTSQQQQQQQQQPQTVIYPQSGYQRPQSTPGKGMAIASMVLGIVSLCSGGYGIVTSIVGLILGVVANKQCTEAGFPTNKMATAGIVMSVIALALSILCVISCFACSSWLEGYINEFSIYDYL